MSNGPGRQPMMPSNRKGQSNHGHNPLRNPPHLLRGLGRHRHDHGRSRRQR
nr:MAG TPA: hypothetical protein [Caudoviricetes sp.]